MLDKNDLKQIEELIDSKNFLTKEDAKDFLTKEDAKDFLTKEDAKDFLTKADSLNFATKDDLKNFATKDDLKNFATKDDLKNLEDKMDARFEAVDFRFKEMDAKLTEQMDYTKKLLHSFRDDIREDLKQIMRTSSEDLIAVNNDVQDNKKRINRLEIKVEALQAGAA